MIAILAALLTSGPGALAAPVPDLVAVRVGRAETGSHGTLEHAVILIEDGKIVTVGEDLPIERGIPILDRPDWVVTPGLVSCATRVGMDSRAGNGFEPQAHASRELWARHPAYRELLEAGVTTLGFYPPGGAIPGQAVAARPIGDGLADMILQDGVYLKIHLESSAKSKKMLREAFEKVDEHEDKVQKAREKWEKDQEKKSKKKSRSKKDDEGSDDKTAGEDEGDDKGSAEDEGDTVFVPPAPDPKVEPFIALRAKDLRALFEIKKAGDYLHLLDALGDEDILWNLRVPLRNDIDLYEVTDRLAEHDGVVVLEPEVTLAPNTRRIRNIPAELQRAGVAVAFVPRSDSVRGHEEWVENVGELLRDGLDRDAAIAALTLNPARVLGLDERLGSIDEGKDANLVFWSGDPFQPGAEVEAVMLDGHLVFEEGKGSGEGHSGEEDSGEER